MFLESRCYKRIFREGNLWSITLKCNSFYNTIYYDMISMQCQSKTMNNNLHMVSFSNLANVLLKSFPILLEKKPQKNHQLGQNLSQKKDTSP